MNKKVLLSMSIASGLLISGGSLVTINKIDHVKAIESVKSNVSKEDIRYKMLNAIDNYKTAKTKASVYYAKQGLKISFEGEVDIVNGRSNIKYTDSYDSSNNVLQTEIISDISKQERLQLNDTKRTYKIDELADLYTDSQTMKKEFLAMYPDVDSRSNSVKVLRPDPTTMELASSVLFPQDVALSYLDNEDNWSIVGEEKMLDRDVVLIEGTFNKKVQENGHETFKMWVDKETGILLKYESYTPDGNLFDYTYVDYLTLNGPTAKNVYDFSVPEGYKPETPELMFPTN